MAVQIFNNMPDVAIHRGDREALPRTGPSLGDWSPRATQTKASNSRAVFAAVTLGVHVIAVLGFLSIRHIRKVEQAPPIVATIIDEVRSADEPPPVAPPPMSEVVYTMPAPTVSIETESITLPEPTPQQTSQPTQQVSQPPLVEYIEFVRAEPPVFPKESQRRREYGTVMLRVTVDAQGRPALVGIERSSGYSRLDEAAVRTAQKFLFRPYVMNGVPQPAQVLIPVEFTRRAS